MTSTIKGNTETITTLRTVYGWSLDAIAKVVGITRPALMKALKTNCKLGEVEQERLNVLLLNGQNYKKFISDAISTHTYEHIWRRAYRNLSERTIL